MTTQLNGKEHPTPILKFGQFLAVKREAMKLSKVDAAKMMGVQYANLWSWENRNSKPSPTYREALKKFYKITDEEMNQYQSKNASYRIHSPHVLTEQKSPVDVEPATKPHVLTEKRRTVSGIIADIGALSNTIGSNMNGITIFEVTLKNKVLDTLARAQELLSKIQLIDEALP